MSMKTPGARMPTRSCSSPEPTIWLFATCLKSSPNMSRAKKHWTVDGMPVPNINHFPEQGSSGGALGLLNVDFIEDVRFYTGGFSAAYGDRLSSVTDIALREGNRDEFDGQLDLSVIGEVGSITPATLKGSLFEQAHSLQVHCRTRLELNSTVKCDHGVYVQTIY